MDGQLLNRDTTVALKSEGQDVVMSSRPVSTAIQNEEQSITLQSVDRDVFLRVEEQDILLSVRQQDITLVVEGAWASAISAERGECGEEAMSALRVIKGAADGLVYYCDGMYQPDIGLAVGITINAVGAGEMVSFLTHGRLEDSSWNWNVNLPIWCGEYGVLTQNTSGLAFTQVVAVPITSKIIFIAIKEAFKTI
jgi:hypothetical protein